MGTKTVVVALVLLALVNRSLTEFPTPCHHFNCGQPPVCNYGLTRVGCLGCCFGCLKGPGEICGGTWYQRGSCAKGLECRGSNSYKSDGICVAMGPSGDDCSHNCTADWDPVRGSDGTAYTNECLLNYVSCRNPSDNITVAHKGISHSDYYPGHCSDDYPGGPVCGSDGITYSKECRVSAASYRYPYDNIVVAHKGECHDDCSYNCKADWVHVCGSDGTTYSNECQLNFTSCRNPSDNIVVAHKEKCDDDCSHICTADWDRVCGSDGTTYDNECLLNYASCRNPSDNIAAAYKGICLDDCSHNCTTDWDPICGSDGTSYENECLLNYASCRNENIVAAHKGICPNLCPEGYFTVGKQCFTGRERGSDMTWNEAQEECKKEGGFLPEPISIPDFQKAVQSQYKKSYSFWLGGSYRKQEGVWSWSSDGTLVGNSGGWYPGHHSKYGEGEHCISMETRWNQQTNARPCDKRYNFVVCEKRKIIVHPGTCPPSHKECSDAHKGLSIHIPQICSDDAECRFYSKCCFDKCLDHHICKPAQDFAFGIFTGNKDTIALSIDRK